jgi:steroid 5-alpha reductase family enzyme
VLAFFWAVPEADMIRKWVVFLLVTAWGVRLTHNWYRGWTGLDHEDWRYINLKRQTKGMYWWVSFSGIHLFPTVLVFLGCLPLFPALSLSGPSFGLIDIIATIVTGAAVLIELVSDNQLRKFRLTNTEKGKIMADGLWKYSRHPNYFGEVMFWWGLFIFSLAVKPEWWYWMFIGALSITLLFYFISIPMIDKRSMERRPHYADHMKKVSGLIPWFPKK